MYMYTYIRIAFQRKAYTGNAEGIYRSYIKQGLCATNQPRKRKAVLASQHTDRQKIKN